MENIVRAMKNCGLAERALIVISLPKFIRLRVSSRYFPESFLCSVHLLLPRNISFLRATRARLSAWWIDSRWNKRDPKVAHFLSTRTPLSPALNFCVDLSIAEIRLKTCDWRVDIFLIKPQIKIPIKTEGERLFRLFTFIWEKSLAKLVFDLEITCTVSFDFQLFRIAETYVSLVTYEIVKVIRRVIYRRKYSNVNVVHHYAVK